jgi:thiol-disulfide isomerase/thioredoxin
MDETRGKTRLWTIIGAAAVAGIAVGVAAVYVTGGLDGNRSDTASIDCAPAVKVAGLLAPLAKGQVAAFQVATEPVSLTDLQFLKGDGTKATIADFAGKTVLLNLWATWCVPCRKEMPALDRLQASMTEPGFEVVAVSIDTQDPSKPKNFLDQIGVKSLAFYADPTTGIFSGLKSRAMAVGLPTTVLINAKGCSLGSISGPAEWDSNDAKALIEAARKSV